MRGDDGPTYPDAMRRRAIALLLTGLTAGVPAGCGGGGHSAPKRTPAAGALSVPLTVEGSRGFVTVFVRVTLEGHRYYFVVDTGAARTFLDARVARKLGLRDAGSPREFATLGCEVSAQPVALASWRLGNASMPAMTVFTHTLLIARAFPRISLAGLLGSDFLARFGAVTIDFTRRRLVLGGGTRTGGATVPMNVVRRDGGVLATSRVAFDGRRARFLIDTGAAISVIDSSAAARLGLQAVGRSTRVAGAVCRGIVTPVLVHGWSFASEHLRRGVIGRSADVLPSTALRAGIVGVVGMATLARFGAVTIDYTHGRMVLGGTRN